MTTQEGAAPHAVPATAAAPLRLVRVGIVDDHDAVRLAVRAALADTADLRLVAAAPTVDGLLSAGSRPPAVALLDLRLADGSTPPSNVERLLEAGCRVLVYTSGESPYLLRSVARTAASGIVLKSDPLLGLVSAVRRAADGRPSIHAALAASIASDPQLRQAKLSRHEQHVLSLFADGRTAQQVADDVDIALSTVEDYIRRIRAKYATVGRTAATKVDLYKRAIEDGLLPTPAAR